MPSENKIVWHDVEMRKSPIHGFGVFALRKFSAGETVLHCDVSRVLSKDEVAALPETERKYTHRLDDQRTLFVQPPERYVNHSCDNNTAVRDFCDVAIRDIPAGEEITSDYSSDGSASKLECSCGAKNCRGFIGAENSIEEISK